MITDSILCCTGYDLDVKQKYFNLLRSKRVDAIILTGSKFVEMRSKDNNYIQSSCKRATGNAGKWLSGGKKYLQHCL